MDIGLFTYITGIASFLGLILQFKDVFPEYRDVRKSIVLVTVGIFAGTLLGALQRVNVTIATPLTWFPMLVAALLLILSIVLIGALITQDAEKRGQAYTAFGWFVVVVLLVLLIGALFNREWPSESQSLSTDELLILAESDASKGNYDRAIHWLERIKGKIALSESDPRRKALTERIAALKQKQVAQPQPPLDR